MAPKYILEQFLQQELLINITEHEVSWMLRQHGVSSGESAFILDYLGVSQPLESLFLCVLCCWMLVPQRAVLVSLAPVCHRK